MFMIVRKDTGEVVRWKVALPKKQGARGKGNHRTRGTWASAMRTKARDAGKRWFAFKHSGAWWLCDSHAVGPSVQREVPSEEAAAMWLHHRA